MKQLLIYNHTDKLYRYKWCFKSEDGHRTSFEYAVTIRGAKHAAKSLLKRMSRPESERQTTMPIIKLEIQD